MTELNPLAQALPASTTGGAAALAADGLADNFDTFLTLLTEQLQNQDPLNPMDSQEFVAQLVQFTSVEQQIASNESLETLLALQAADARMSATDFIGKDVTASSQQTLLQNGSASWEYSLPRAAETTELLVYDASGRLVGNLPGQTSAGAHAASWNGLDAGGNAMPDGIYSLEVVAKDADGARIDAPVRITARVTGVEMFGDDVRVEMGGLMIPSGQVIAVRAPSAGQPAV